MISALKAYLSIAWALKTPFILLLDRKYKVTSLSFVGDLVGSTPRGIFEDDIADCDDYAWRLKAMASGVRSNGIGFVIGWASWARFHCWNCAVTDDGVYQIEPQGGRLFKKDRRYRALLVIL